MDFKLGKFQYGFVSTATSGGTLTLVAGSRQFQIFTGTLAHILKLPDATTTSNGSGIAFTVINNSTGIITVQNNAGTQLTTVPAGSSVDLILTDHSSANGVWAVSNFAAMGGGGAGSVTPGSIISSNYSVVTGDKGRVLQVNSASGAINVTLPAPVADFVVTVKDIAGSSSLNSITVVRNSSDTIDGQTSNIINTPYEARTFISDGTNWFVMSNLSLSVGLAPMGIFAGGYAGANSPVIDYVFIATAANATAFGSLSSARYGVGSVGSSQRAIFQGGQNGAPTNIIDYVSFATLGNAVSFGTLSQARFYGGSFSNATRGLLAGGFIAPPGGTATIDYITMATTGNSTSFGNLSFATYGLTAGASPTRGIIFENGNTGDKIEYVTIATTSNSSAFGNGTLSRSYPGACSNSVRAIVAGGSTGGNTYDSVIIATLSNATNYGTLTSSNRGAIAGAASPIRGVFSGNSTTVTGDYVLFATGGAATTFGNLTVARDINNGGCSNAHGGL